VWDAGQGGRGQPGNVRTKTRRVFYADGEKTSTLVIHAVLHHLGARITHFEDTRECLDSLRISECHLLISNARQPAVEGVALLLDAKRIVPFVPVIMMVDHADIQTAVRAMKGGAVDCVERPPERNDLVTVIGSALQQSRPSWTLLKKPLTCTEEQVLQLILKGHTTAEAAHRLHRSKRTVEVHRSHIMRKLQVGAMVDLVRKCAQLRLLQDWP